jgi:hypothetical protein
MKNKETLEEVAEKILFDNTKDIEIRYRGGQEKIIKSMIDMAKWQTKRMYSEEEVVKIINSFEKLCLNYLSNKDWFPSKKTEWFEQFKKK